MTEALDDLFVDPRRRMLEALGAAIRPYARMASEAWGFFPEHEFDNLDAKRKLVVILLALKASYLGGKVKSDSIEKEELCSLAGVPSSSYGVYAPQLEQMGLIHRDGSAVLIPDDGVVRASRFVLSKEPSTTSKSRSTEASSGQADDASDQPSGAASPANFEVGTRPKPHGRRSGRSAKVKFARYARDFEALYQGRVDISTFPHPSKLRSDLERCLLPLSIASVGYKLAALPIAHIRRFLQEKYKTDIPEDRILALLDEARGKYVDSRKDPRLSYEVFWLLLEGKRVFDPNTSESAVDQVTSETDTTEESER